MRFEIGDTVVHPTLGAGVLTNVKELQQDEDTKRYYNIELMGRRCTSVMVPVQSAEEIGLRPGLGQSELDDVWDVLQAKPTPLPQDYRRRHRMMGDRLRDSDSLQLAELVRDIAGWKEDSGLTARGKRLYRRAMRRLAGEVASALDISLRKGRKRIKAAVGEISESKESEAEGQSASLRQRLRNRLRRVISG
jgi:CarD family transcriptional regulator